MATSLARPSVRSPQLSGTPKATPPQVVTRLNAEVVKIVSNPDVVKAWKAQGANPMPMGVAEFTKYMNDDIVKWAHIVKVSGAKPEQ